MTDSKKAEPAKKTGRKKGTPKTGGRQKGTPNQTSLYIRTELQNAGLNLIQRTLSTIDQLASPEAKIAALMELYPYVYPALREIESPDAPPPPPATPAAAVPAEGTPPTRQERLALIRGQVPGQSSASGQ